MKANDYFRILTTGLIAVSISQGMPATQEEKRCKNVVWIGNSYSIWHGLIKDTMQMLEEENPDECFNKVLAVAGNGQRMSSFDDNRITNKIIKKREEWDAFDYLILQEQSQIPGFFFLTADFYQDSINAVERLVTRLQEYNDDQGSGVRLQTVLYQTWGHRVGDKANPAYYPDYQSMQALLIEGYDIYRQTIEDLGVDAIVAPVGEAWEMVYDDVAIDQELEGQEVNPSVRGNRFWDLYRGDGRHPSTFGTYLAASVIYATITGKDPRETVAATPDCISDSSSKLYKFCERGDGVLEEAPLRAYYASVAAAVVHNRHDHITFQISDEEQESPETRQQEPPTYSKVTVRITFDRYPEEIGWSISVPSGPIIEEHSVGEFSSVREYALQTYEWIVDLDTTPIYHFTIEDSFGDGLQEGKSNGEYLVYITETEEVLAEGGDFGEYDVKEFSLS